MGELTGIGDVADGARGDEYHARLGLFNLGAQEVHEVMVSYAWQVSTHINEVYVKKREGTYTSGSR